MMAKHTWVRRTWASGNDNLWRQQCSTCRLQLYWDLSGGPRGGVVYKWFRDGIVVASGSKTPPCKKDR